MNTNLSTPALGHHEVSQTSDDEKDKTHKAQHKKQSAGNVRQLVIIRVKIHPHASRMSSDDLQQSTQKSRSTEL